MLENFNNYGPYEQLVKTGKIVINTDEINIDNWNNHFNGILNILRDGIELEEVQSMFIGVNFGDDIEIELQTCFLQFLVNERR